eukprot:15327312-Heterocapsa_arctica.AAC.1
MGSTRFPAGRRPHHQHRRTMRAGRRGAEEARAPSPWAKGQATLAASLRELVGPNGARLQCRQGRCLVRARRREQPTTLALHRKPAQREGPQHEGPSTHRQ